MQERPCFVLGPFRIEVFQTTYKYSFRLSSRIVDRTVVPFEAEVMAGTHLIDLPSEHRRAPLGRWWQWLSLPEVLDVLFHGGRKRASLEAHKFLTGGSLPSRTAD